MHYTLVRCSKDIIISKLYFGVINHHKFQEQDSRNLKMTYQTMCIAACAKNNNFGRGATRPQIKAFIAAANGGKCVASAVSRALKAGMAAGTIAQKGKKFARFIATDAGRASIKPKPKKK